MNRSEFAAARSIDAGAALSLAPAEREALRARFAAIRPAPVRALRATPARSFLRSLFGF